MVIVFSPLETFLSVVLVTECFACSRHTLIPLTFERKISNNEKTKKVFSVFNIRSGKSKDKIFESFFYISKTLNSLLSSGTKIVSALMIDDFPMVIRNNLYIGYITCCIRIEYFCHSKTVIRCSVDIFLLKFFPGSSMNFYERFRTSFL